MMIKPQPEHLADDQFLAYLEHRLDSAEQARVEEHLAGCPRCRDDLLAAVRVRRSQRARRYAAIGIPAAAAAVLALVLVGQGTRVGSQAPMFRASNDAASTVVIVSPTDGETLQAGRIVFVWDDIAESARYRFTLTNSDGDDIWTADLTDTTATLPTTVALVGTQTYFWYVDVFLPNGASATSEVHGFTIIP
jgi:hypothetical protein